MHTYYNNHDIFFKFVNNRLNPLLSHSLSLSHDLFLWYTQSFVWPPLTWFVCIYYGMDVANLACIGKMCSSFCTHIQSKHCRMAIQITYLLMILYMLIWLLYRQDTIYTRIFFFFFFFDEEISFFRIHYGNLPFRARLTRPRRFKISDCSTSAFESPFTSIKQWAYGDSALGCFISTN